MSAQDNALKSCLLAREALAALLRTIRNNAPELSGKTLGDAEAAIKAIDALEAAQQAAPEAGNAAAWKAGYKHGAWAAAPQQAAPAQPEPDMRHPKIQALIGSRARYQIEMQLIEQLAEDPNFETTSMDMEYWGPLHDRLKEALTKQAAQPEPQIDGWPLYSGLPPPAAQPVASWDWLRGVMGGIPTRMEFIGGQQQAYIAKEAVMGWLHEGQSRAAKSAAAQPMRQELK